jgi:hypothetical protein
MHIVAEQAMRVAELAMPAVAFPTARAAAAAPMVVADVAEWFE